MQTYVFYFKDKDVKIIPKCDLTESEINKLKERGFKKYHLEIEANDKKDAVTKLNESTSENLKALSDFSGSYLFSAVFIILALCLAYYYL